MGYMYTEDLTNPVKRVWVTQNLEKLTERRLPWHFHVTLLMN